ncbi:MAG: stalk domain-containing protein [Cellulosilyticaceae bacterium]
MKNTLKKRVALVAALLVGTSALTLNAANIKKQIEAGFYNIKVTHNGQYKAIPDDREPFMYNDRVYVAVADVSSISGMDAKWDPTSKTVKLTSDTANQSTEIANKNLEIAKLKSEVASLQEKLSNYEEEEETKPEEGKDVLPNISQKDIDSMISYLTKYYDEDLDIDWTFDLVANKDAGRLDLKVSYKNSIDSTYFTEVYEDELEDFLLDLCDAIQKEFGKVVIKGELVGRGKVLTIFDMNKSGSLSMLHEKENLQLDRLNYIMNDDSAFDKLAALSTVGPSTGIVIDNIDVSPTRGFKKLNITLTTTLTKETDLTKWNEFHALKSTHPDKKKLTRDFANIMGLVSDFFDMESDDISLVLHDDSTTGIILAESDSDYGLITNEWK